MRVLAVDPGARRAGWAILETGPVYVASAVEHFPRPKEEPFQRYRMRLTERWVELGGWLLTTFKPDVVVTETVPSTGANNMSQLYLANVMATTLHTVCVAHDVPVSQVSARSVSSRIAIRGRGSKITKPQIRNGVLAFLPELRPRLSDWVKVFEEPDAIAIGLHALGYKV